MASGLVTEAYNPGFCWSIAESIVEPERGNPEIK